MLNALKGIRQSIHVSGSQRCMYGEYLTDGVYLFPAAAMVSAPARIDKLREWIEKEHRDGAYSRRSVTAESCGEVWRSAVDKATAPAVAAADMLPKADRYGYDLVEFTTADDGRPSSYADAKKLAFAYSHTKFDAVRACPDSELAPLALYRDGGPVGVLMPVRAPK